MKSIGYMQALARPLPTYTGPPWPQPVVEEPVTDAEVADFKRRWSATCSDKVARLLCALEKSYGIAPARSGRPAV